MRNERESVYIGKKTINDRDGTCRTGPYTNSSCKDCRAIAEYTTTQRMDWILGSAARAQI